MFFIDINKHSILILSAGQRYMANSATKSSPVVEKYQILCFPNIQVKHTAVVYHCARKLIKIAMCKTFR